MSVHDSADFLNSSLAHCTARRSLRSLLAFVAVGLLAVAALFALAPPAVAHDELVDTQFVVSDEGDVEAVVLSFSATLLDVGTEIMATGPDASDVSGGTPTQSGRDITQPFAEDLSAGMYDVVWRVVSSDGHPIEGAFSFEVTTAPADVPTVLPYNDSASAENDEVSGEEPDTDATADSTGTNNASEGFPLAGTIGIVLVVVVVIAGVITISKQRRRPADPEEEDL